MSDDLELFISESTFAKMLACKDEMGFIEKGWTEWFDYLFDSVIIKKTHSSNVEEVFEKIHYDKNYEQWVKNFALNLHDIWNEQSARILDPDLDPKHNVENKSCIVIGAGPSIRKHDHLAILAKSNYQGSIICTDRMLIPCLEEGITPEKFQKFYVVTIDGAEILQKFYDDAIVSKYGQKINGIFSTIIHPATAEKARKAGIKIHWLHSLFDYGTGKKSFNQISGLMVRAKSHTGGLPAIQTGGNVGTSAWFIAWKLLKLSKITLIGIDHSWDVNDPWDVIAAHTNAPRDMDKNSPLFNKLFPKVYNPEFKSYCMLDPVFQYYSNAFKEFISRSPEWLTTINATEGGCLFGERIQCTTLENFLRIHQD